MHIVFWSPGWPLEKFQNGIVTYVHWMRRELELQGNQVSVLTSNIDGAVNDPRVHLVKQPRVRRALRRIFASNKDPQYEIFDVPTAIADCIKQLHRREPVDIIEMEESFGWSAEVARRTNIPVVVKLHGPAFLSMIGQELQAPFAKEKIEREGLALRAATAIISPCASTLQQTILRYGLNPRFRAHIVNPMTLPDEAPRWALDSCETDTILFVGRFDLRKGGDIVLRSFAQILKSGRRCRLLFVGPDMGIEQADGTRIHFEAYRNSTIPEEHRHLVDFRGRLPNFEIAKLRTRAMVTVVASRWENPGYTLLEAMLQGCPVVSSDTVACAETVEDGRTGLLAKSEDPASFAEKITWVLKNPAAAAALGEEARRRVTELYSARRVAEQSVQLYRTVIAA